jgi:hypothetical protein
LFKKCRFIPLCSWHIPMISKFKSFLTIYCLKHGAIY